MEQEYKVGLFWRIFYGLTVGGLLIVFSLVVIAALPEEPVYLVFLLPILMCLVVLINIFKSKVIITSTGITRVRLFYNKALNFENIKGVRIESKIIFIEPLDSSYPRVKISNYDSFGKSEELAKWLRAKFIDLDKQDKEKANAFLLQDQNLGNTPEERRAKADKVKQFGVAYMVFGFVISLILLLIGNSYASFFVSIVYPVLGAILMKYSYGLIKFLSNSKSSVRLGIAIGYFWPIALIFFTAVSNYHLLSYNHVWIIAATLALLLFVLLFTTGIDRSLERVPGQAIFMLVLSLFFGFGTAVVSNCIFDRSASEKFRTQVEDTYITTGRGSHYHLRLSPWRPGQNAISIDVPRNEYERSPVGTLVIINQKQGLFYIPWFSYTIDAPPPAY